MKLYRILLIAFLSFFFSTLNAQYFADGNILITNSTNKTEYGNTTTQYVSDINLTFSPYVVKFLSDKIAIGSGSDRNKSFNIVDKSADKTLDFIKSDNSLFRWQLPD